MFNAHPDGLTIEQLIEHLTHVYRDDAYVIALCERIDSLQEVIDKLESEVGYAEERLSEAECELEDLRRELEGRDD